MGYQYAPQHYAVHVDNCQIGVFAAYASRHGRALIDRELYLPKTWAAEPDRKAGAAVPEARRFMTKPELAVRMMIRILAEQAPVAWVAADEVYGRDRKFRAACLHRNVGYVAAVPRNEPIPTTRAGTRRIDTLAAQAPHEAWTRISAGDGTKGPRLYDWAAVRISSWWDEQEGIGHWALIRRSITDPTETAFYLCAWAPQTLRSRSLYAWPGRAGRSRSASRLRRTTPAWTSTRCVPTPAGTGTPPSRCSRMPSSPRSPPRRPQRGNQ
jgi:hypothetical protein